MLRVFYKLNTYSLEKFISQAQVPMVSVVVDEQELVWIIQISDSPNTVLIAGA
jgi:hypothetical protein